MCWALLASSWRGEHKMLRCRHLVLLLVWQLVGVEGGFASVRHRDDWNNWIILPAKSRTNEMSGSFKDFSDYRANQSDVMNNYLDRVRMKSYIMTISGKDEKKRERLEVMKEERNEQHSKDDLILPLGRAIARVKNIFEILKDLFFDDYDWENDGRAPTPTSTTRKIKKLKKKYKKFLLPLVIAYKLKFLTLIPVLIGGLILLVGTTGLAGFFFALFTAVMSLRSDNKLEIKKW